MQILYMDMENCLIRHNNPFKFFVNKVATEKQLTDFIDALLKDNKDNQHYKLINPYTREGADVVSDEFVYNYIYNHDCIQLLQLAFLRTRWTIDDVTYYKDSNGNLMLNKMTELTYYDWNNIIHERVGDFIRNNNADALLNIAFNLLFLEYDVKAIDLDMYRLGITEEYRRYNSYFTGVRFCAVVHYLLNPRAAYHEDTWWCVLRHLLYPNKYQFIWV